VTPTVDADPVRILAICTANVCRSPAIELLLRTAMARAGVPADDVVVSSAGADARDGSTRCARSRRLLATHVEDDEATWTARSHRLTVDDLHAADLVLTASREHRASIARLLPAARSHTFTLRQAARAAGEIAGGELPSVVPLPPAGDVRGRLRWLVAELDAVRGPVGDPLDDDVPDPHVVGDAEHEPAMALMAAAVADLAALVRLVRAHP
jgi:protein-tyrosine phosphatase